MESDEKLCPRCAETIKSAAIACRFCGHEFDPQKDGGKRGTTTSKNGGTTCSKCGKYYASKFKACPHCNGSRGKGCLIAIGVIFLLAVIISISSGDHSSSSSPSTSESGAAPEKDAANGTCHDDWTKCKDNGDLVNNYSKWVDVEVGCKIEANDEAKFGTPEWPWLAFGSYLKGDAYVTSGVAVAIENDAHFQNGFGAMVHSTVVCNYDLRAQKVISINIEPH